MSADDKDPRRVAAGRKGGETTRDGNDPDYYRRIGRLGGAKGGQTTRDRYGIEHYRRIGAKGGKAGAGTPKSTTRRSEQQ